MIRTIIIVTVFCLTAGNCFGQGLLDSVLGPGGLGVWGSNQNVSTPNYGPYGSGAPNAQYQPPQQQQYQAQAPMHPGYNQPGVYGDWQNYPPAVTGTPEQMQYPASADGSAVQQQYSPQAQAQQQQYPPQYQQQAPQAQGGRPMSWQAPPGQPQPQPQAVQGGQAPMQGQAQPQQAPPQVSAEDLPAGAVRITTTTPDGTSVEYYPPAGQPMYAPEQAPPAPPQPQPVKPRRLKHKQAKEQKPAQAAPNRGPIAMPKPVPIPQNQDPRYGWGVAPSAPTAE